MKHQLKILRPSSTEIQQLFIQLDSGANGIKNSLARRRLSSQRKKEKRQSQFQKTFKLFVRQFTNPLILILVIVVVLSAILGETSDTVIIFLIIIVSGVLGFVQELNAGKAAQKLLKLIHITHQVIREGQEITVKSDEVVPGDIILFNAGDTIPADCRIVESNSLYADESSLTGESYPVEKFTGILPEDFPLSKKHNCLWRGTHIIAGSATALAVNTGESTVFGQTTKGLGQFINSAYEQGITKFGYFLLKTTILLSGFILLTNLYFDKPFFNSLLFSLALAIGMAPELLPAIMSFTMAAGARRMQKKKVIVKKMSSILNLGEVNVLCTDKTGTITEGTTRLIDVVNADGLPDADVRFLAFLNSYFENGFSNPIDNELSALNLQLNGYEKEGEIPYDFIRKRLSISVKNKSSILLITKGAVPNIVKICSSYKDGQQQVKALSSAYIQKIESAFVRYGDKGLRVIAICSKSLKTGGQISHTDEQDMIFNGFILFEDPLKATAAASIKRLDAMKIAVKIITGDNRYAAQSTAIKLGINNPTLLTGSDLNKMSAEALVVKAAGTTVFAEVEPHQKERIVEALKKGGNTVAYLGDGINDVAAIHAADTGLSTNNAVDVAKEAADFVLLEKDLSVLADGVLEGRTSFANSMKYILITTGCVFGNMFSVAGASLILPFLPMLPKQILLTNLITDIPYLAIASDNVDKEEISRPLKWDLKLIRRFMILYGLHSSIFDFITFYALYYYFQLHDSAFQTGWFIESVITELLIVFILRTRKSVFYSRPKKFLWVINLIVLVITALLPVSPLASYFNLTIAHAAQAWCISAIIVAYLITAELLKLWFFKRMYH